MSRNLTILQVTNRIPYPLNDGGNLATFHAADQLRKMGHKVILASLNTHKHYQNPDSIKDIFPQLYTTYINTTLTIGGLLKGFFQKTPYNISRFYTPEFAVQLQEVIKKEKPDLVQLEGIYLAIYINAIRACTKVPILLRSHNVEYEIWQRNASHEKNILKKWYLTNLSHKIKKFEKTYLHSFDAIAAITERDAEFYKKNKYKGKLLVFPAGVDMDAYSRIISKQSELSLCFLGSMEWIPNLQGIEWFLETCWPTIHQKFPTLSLHIGGKGMTSEMKERKIPGVVFYGTVPNALAFVSAHPIVVVPLLAGGGMRLKIVEAMAAGRCVISTSVGAEGIEATPSKEILIADNADEYLNHLTTLSANPNKLEQIQTYAYALAQEKYSWQKLVRTLEKFYLEVL